MKQNNTDIYDLIIDSPGRVNLIGEHIDYNGGHVLPAAINLGIKLSFKKNNTNSASFWSTDFDKGFKVDLKKIKPSEHQWENYILGVLFHINEARPNSIKGFDCIIESRLPIGSGVSSSAALECGIAKGVNSLFKLNLSDDKLIEIAREAEHSFVGTNCGIMDQFAVVKGTKNGLIYLNCHTLDYKIIKSDFSPYEIILLNTNVSHNLATSEYNQRREECEKIFKIVKSEYPKYDCLAEVSMSVLLKLKSNIDVDLFERALYVLEENHRVKQAVKALKRGDLKDFGKLLYQSHKGLREYYKVSCEELDFLVDYSKPFESVIGSRMMGGGFGGCTINLIHEDFSDEYIVNVSKAYKKEFNIDLTATKASIGNGVTVEENGNNA